MAKLDPKQADGVHRHNFDEICYILRGRANVILGDEMIEVERDDDLHSRWD